MDTTRFEPTPGWEMSEKEYLDYYMRVRGYDKKNIATPDSSYDEYFRKVDSLVMKRERKDLSDIEIGKDELDWTADWSGRRPKQGNEYIENQEEYCRILKEKLVQRFHNDSLGYWKYGKLCGEPVFPPADLLPFHDAIFMENEQVPDHELKTKAPPVPKFWWDHDVLQEEFKDRKTDVESRVNEYLENSSSEQK